MKGNLKIGLPALSLLLTLLVSSPPLLSQEEKKPDNTTVNKRDRNKDEATADQQKQNQSDIELARQIRRSIVKDKSLSSYAHNIKIIAQNGTVTLKGPVRSVEEKEAIEAKAAEVAGAANVKDELAVAAPSEKQSNK